MDLCKLPRQEKDKNQGQSLQQNSNNVRVNGQRWEVRDVGLTQGSWGRLLVVMKNNNTQATPLEMTKYHNEVLHNFL